jgi:hypothetical protein
MLKVEKRGVMQVFAEVLKKGEIFGCSRKSGLEKVMSKSVFVEFEIRKFLDAQKDPCSKCDVEVRGMDQGASGPITC